MKRGCDLLTLFSTKQNQEIAASFHSTAPTRIREVTWLFEIVENNIHDLPKRDIKSLQIVVLSQF